MADWDWVTISALATGLGTLVLASATFASVRSGNRSARIAERALAQGLRPLLFPSRMSDEPLKVAFQDGHMLRVPGGQGVAEVTESVIYLAMSLRNVGSGLAVLHGWVVTPRLLVGDAGHEHSPVADFRRLTRDLYVPSGDIFFWQGALRDPAEPVYADVAAVVQDHSPFIVELLYGDEEGGQRTITRYSILPHRTGDSATIWLTGVARHWNLDRADPR
jgi:hypothetical protein